MSGKFRFKEFEMENERSAMKVNTDGVLLGALATLPEKKGGGLSVLDAGTGGGTVALMLAQRLSHAGFDAFCVTGVEMDAPSFEEASTNFALSPWSEHLKAVHADVRSCIGSFDMIVSNPPFYDASLPAPDERRNAARHGGDGMGACSFGEPFSFVTLLDFASGHLATDGILSMVLPADQERLLGRMAGAYGLGMSRVVRVRTAAAKPCKRIIAEFGFRPVSLREETIALLDTSGECSEAYRSLMSPFYLWA